MKLRWKEEGEMGGQGENGTIILSNDMFIRMLYIYIGNNFIFMLAVKRTSCIGDTVYLLMMMPYLIAVGLWEQSAQLWESTLTSASISINCCYIFSVCMELLVWMWMHQNSMPRVALILCSCTPTGLVLQHILELIQEG